MTLRAIFVASSEPTIRQVASSITSFLGYDISRFRHGHRAMSDRFSWTVSVDRKQQKLFFPDVRSGISNPRSSITGSLPLNAVWIL